MTRGGRRGALQFSVRFPYSQRIQPTLCAGARVRKPTNGPPRAGAAARGRRERLSGWPVYQMVVKTPSEPVFLFPSWERPVVGNLGDLSDIVGPNWELGPSRGATPTGSLGVMGVWKPKKLAWEAGSPKRPAFLSDASSAYVSRKTTNGELTWALTALPNTRPVVDA
eukprot:COSAG02_NODE_158_length_32954_cov_16.416771_27_plen_167_part_00